jgi:xylulokinase
VSGGPYLLGLDVGTYESKGVLAAPSGEILASAALPHGLSIPQPGWAEHDADAVWWTSVVALCGELLATSGISPREIGAVGCSAIGPTMLPLDQDGQPLRPAILYGIDTRAHRQIEEMTRQAGGEEAVVALCGMALTAQAVGPKIRWFQEHEPALYARTRAILTASSYLVYRLTGQLAVDSYTATYFGPLFDAQRLRWTDQLWPGAPLHLLAPPRWPAEVAGAVTARAARETRLAEGTPVIAGTVDAVAEAISAGVVTPGDLMLMYGTTLFFIQVLAQPLSHPSLWSAVYAEQGLHALAAGPVTAGALTRWFRDHLAPDLAAAETATGLNAYAVLAAEAAGVPAGAQGLLVLPYFSGERTPINDPQARGVIAGLTLAHTRAHLYRAMLEGVAYAIRHNVEAMAAAGAPPRRLVAVGGGTRNRTWLQIVSDVTGLPQDLPAVTLGACYGDAFLAGLGLDLFPNLAAARERWSAVAERIAPHAGCHALYDEYYAHYLALYPHCRPELHALADLAARVPG